MIQYTLSCANRMSQNVQIRLFFEVKDSKSVELGLPAWRPGRYEFQQYARNIFEVKAFDANQNPLGLFKTERNTWTLSTPHNGPVEISYQYSCTQFDAGGSWIDDTLLYINPINCLFYVKGREQESCSITLEGLNASDHVASNLLFTNGTAQTEHYFKLADSPFFLSEQPGYDHYSIDGVTFHIWTHGEIAYNKGDLLKHFTAFTKIQLAFMETFPEKEYHFLLLLLPFTHYHGVEHQQSTVITLGPSQDLAKPHLYEELISISSHELYHAWNICKIRPAEMYPYRLHEENYFRTGFVAEGITTYLGEYFLRQSGFFSEERFLLEIEQWFNRHQLHRGFERASLADSSFDLWVDGYVASSADFKVSIYVAGALSAIALDLQIRLANPDKSILDLMRILYKENTLHKKGYTEASLRKEIQLLIGEEEQKFWNQCITGHSIVSYVSHSLEQFGITVQKTPSPFDHERLLGIKLKPGYSKLEIAKLQVDSPSFALLMVDDVLLAVNNKNISTLKDIQDELEGSNNVTFTVQRKGRTLSIAIPLEDKGNYWAKMSLQKTNGLSDKQGKRYDAWLHTTAYFQR